MRFFRSFALALALAFLIIPAAPLGGVVSDSDRGWRGARPNAEFLRRDVAQFRKLGKQPSRLHQPQRIQHEPAGRRLWHTGTVV